jgi:cytochrome c
MKAIMFACVVSAVGVLTAPQPSQAGDAQRGEDVFRYCAGCHSPEPGKHKSGPSLAGVVGRPAGSVEGYYGYSPAMQARGEAGVVWTPEELQAFLADPRGVVPGSRMPAPLGLKDDTDRADVVAYLQTLKP